MYIIIKASWESPSNNKALTSYCNVMDCYHVHIMPPATALLLL